MQFTIRNKDYKHRWVDNHSSFFNPSCMSHSLETARDLPRKRVTRGAFASSTSELLAWCLDGGDPAFFRMI